MDTGSCGTMYLKETLPLTSGTADRAIDVLSDHVSLQKYIQHKCQFSAGRNDVQDAFSVADLGRLVDVHQMWNNALPDIQPFYAVKCNDQAMLLKILASMGTGFDCSSKNEIQYVLDLDVSPDRIIFANPIKPVSHLKYAERNGVKKMTFDNTQELYKIKEHFPTARLVLRIIADCPEAIFPLGSKFGCTFLEAKELLQLAKSLNLDIMGVSFHVGTLSKDPTSYSRAIALSHDVFQFASSLGYHMTLLDIGGGYPGKNDDQSRSLFGRIAEEVNKGLEKFEGWRDLKVISEPGFFYPCSCYAIVLNITGKRIVKKPNEEKPVIMYYLNDGVYGLFNHAMYTEYNKHVIHPQPVKDISRNAPKNKSVLWGPTCDSNDRICDRELPELEVGDWIYFNEMGSYSYTITTQFNSIERPALYYYIRESKRDFFSRMK